MRFFASLRMTYRAFGGLSDSLSIPSPRRRLYEPEAFVKGGR